MHSAPMPDSAGEFDEWKKSEYPCSKCKGIVKYRVWESSCGGYEDYNFRCDNCKYTWWIDGDDG